MTAHTVITIISARVTSTNVIPVLVLITADALMESTGNFWYIVGIGMIGCKLCEQDSFDAKVLKTKCVDSDWIWFHLLYMGVLAGHLKEKKGETYTINRYNGPCLHNCRTLLYQEEKMHLKICL